VKRTSIVLLILFWIGYFGWLIVKFVIKPNGIRYYSDAPHRILLPLFIGIIGGLTIFAYDRLPSKLQKVTLLLFIALLATILTVSSLYLLYISIWMFSFIPGSTVVWQVLLFSLLLAAISTYLWWKFWQRMRKKKG